MHKQEEPAPVFQPDTSPFVIRPRDPTRTTDRSPFASPRGPDAYALYIGDLPLDATEREIRTVLSRFGNIETVNILRKDVADGKR
jgi:RNA recognition motif-containing protein